MINDERKIIISKFVFLLFFFYFYCFFLNENEMQFSEYSNYKLK